MPGPKPRPVSERFQEKWIFIAPTGCWDWTASIDGNGYGKLGVKGKFKRASRISYELHKGPIPDGLCVLHTCDNPKCVNPDHLFLGTLAENTRDMMRKGRSKLGTNLEGEKHGRAKLKAKDVLAIREMRRRHPGQSGVFDFLVRWFGVSPSQACAVANGISWGHI
jgi:hypothetical protein